MAPIIANTTYFVLDQPGDCIGIASDMSPSHFSGVSSFYVGRWMSPMTPKSTAFLHPQKAGVYLRDLALAARAARPGRCTCGTSTQTAQRHINGAVFDSYLKSPAIRLAGRTIGSFSPRWFRAGRPVPPVWQEARSLQLPFRRVGRQCRFEP